MTFYFNLFFWITITRYPVTKFTLGKYPPKLDHWWLSICGIIVENREKSGLFYNNFSLLLLEVGDIKLENYDIFPITCNIINIALFVYYPWFIISF